MNLTTDIKIVCTTPTKNEAWILDKFLKCTSLWADRIIIADQMSTDGTRDIARKYPKVTLIDNPTEGFNEDVRVRLMMNEVRNISGKKLILALDADEILTANYFQSKEWDTMINAEPGAVFRFQRVNMFPGMEKCWIEPGWFYFGLIDDGYEGRYEVVHGYKLPLRDISRAIDIREIKILHYQYQDLERVKSKARWYQVWHSLDRSALSPIGMFRLYHPIEHVSSSDIIQFQKEWIEYYEEKGIDMKTVSRGLSWWEKEVLEYFAKYGAAKFRKLDIWDVDWNEIADRLSYQHTKAFIDPRNSFEKHVHLWLTRTQTNPWSIRNKIIAKLLSFFGW